MLKELEEGSLFCMREKALRLLSLMRGRFRDCDILLTGAVNVESCVDLALCGLRLPASFKVIGAFSLPSSGLLCLSFLLAGFEELRGW